MNKKLPRHLLSTTKHLHKETKTTKRMKKSFHFGVLLITLLTYLISFSLCASVPQKLAPTINLANSFKEVNSTLFMKHVILFLLKLENSNLFFLKQKEFRIFLYLFYFK